MTPITNIADLRKLARRRLPRVLFDYVESGSYDEITLRANVEALQGLRFRQRVLVDTTSRSLETELVGDKVSMPVAIAPTGLTGLVRGGGEILAARAAEVAGIPYCLSTMSIATIEDIRAATRRPFWFQLYVLRDRGFSQSMIERARAANCPVLVVTVDVPLRGQRHSDIRNGLTVPLRLTLRNMWDVATRPGWALDVLMSKRKTFGNIEAYLNKSRVNMLGAGEWSTQHFDQTLNWCDMEWLRSLWPGKLVIKGILDVEDAHKAVSVGADAIVVSNHGGRQLDGAPASIAVPEISGAVGDRIEVLFDGGIRSGQDVMKALALGARAAAESGAARPDRQNLRQHVNDWERDSLRRKTTFPSRAAA